MDVELGRHAIPEPSDGEVQSCSYSRDTLKANFTYPAIPPQGPAFSWYRPLRLPTSNIPASPDRSPFQDGTIYHVLCIYHRPDNHTLAPITFRPLPAPIKRPYASLVRRFSNPSIRIHACHTVPRPRQRPRPTAAKSVKTNSYEPQERQTQRTQKQRPKALQRRH